MANLGMMNLSLMAFWITMDSYPARLECPLWRYMVIGEPLNSLQADVADTIITTSLWISKLDLFTVILCNHYLFLTGTRWYFRLIN